MPKFKQFTDVNIKIRRSQTSGNCTNEDGFLVNCTGIENSYTYQTEAACLAATGTWTASFTKVTCKALIAVDDGFFKWVGDKYTDFTDTKMIIMDLEKIKNYEKVYDKLTGSFLSGYTHVITESGKYIIDTTLEDFMGIMAVEVK